MGWLARLMGGGQAPSLVGTTWFNVDGLPAVAKQRVAADEPINFAHDIKQPVVLLFWDYECIKCRDILQRLQQWWIELGSRGLLVMGIHTPEYEAEAYEESVENAVLRSAVTYPVLSDPELVNWEHFKPKDRPQVYLVNNQGKIITTASDLKTLPRLRSQLERLLGYAIDSTR